MSIFDIGIVYNEYDYIIAIQPQDLYIYVNIKSRRKQEFGMAFNEDTRVKIPAIITLTRLGYKYLSLKDAKWDEETNIFTDIF